MNRYAVFVLLAAVITISAVNADEVDVSEAAAASFGKTVMGEVGVEGVTPLRSIFIPHLSNLKCWICSYPCGAYYCCNDGYPQCCLVSGRCRCCRG